MWRPNRTTVFKDGSNVSDIYFQKQVFISTGKAFQYKSWSDHCFTNSQRLCASNQVVVKTPKSLADSVVGRMVSFIL